MIERFFGFVIWPLLLRLGKKAPKCKSCRKRMEKQERPLLFLLPLYHDDAYTPSASYYSKYCRMIDDMTQIPAGQRACRMWTCVCQQCGQKKVLVEDFLQVHGEEVPEKYVIYDMAELSSLFYGND